ncbi:MAG: nucleotidyltransferase domain-containing protein [Myxococcaceae bacterium]
MTSRISALAEVDPLSVPLPHGTEVTLRVERLLHGKRVPQGLVGRVVRARDGGFDVLVTGVGELWYERAELAPRRLGQLHFAQRREAAWQSLHPCRVLEATVGSQAWGLADDQSDTDLRGAFALPFSWTGGLAEPPVDLVSADGSATYWEVRKLVEQALRADPNTLELLFVPSVKALDEIGQWVLDAREAFVSKLLFGSFGRYALSQLDKLSASQRLAEHRDLVLAWLCEDPAPGLDELARRLAAKIDGRTDGDAVHAARVRLKQLYRSLWDQGLLERNDLEGLTAYARAGGRRPPDARSLRPKNAYNLLRLIELARGWLETGTPTFAATGAFRDTLLSIKRGELELDEVVRRAEAMSPALEAARDGSKLPEQPDFERADALLRRIHEELARRHVRGEAWPRVRVEVASAPAPQEGQGTWAHFTPHQRTIASAALALESSRREHVVISLSGAHAYGFPSPDSDLDLKAVHLAPTRALLGFAAQVPPAERLEIIEGVEIDYSSNELGGVLQGVLKGNGNYLERFLSGFTLSSGRGFEPLVPLVQASLSTRLARHYFGFATQQRAAWEQGGRASAKKLLYVLRTLLTGTHALREGLVVTDLSVLAPKYELGDALELIEQKRRGEKSELPAALAQAWATRVDSVFALLARAEAESTLPAEPPTDVARALEEALVSLRLR